MPTLRSLCYDQYFRLNLRITDEKTRRQYGFALDNFRDMLGREPRIPDLTDDTLTSLIIWLRDVKRLHPRTCNDRRSRINALWRWLADREYLTRRPTNCALTVPRTIPRAWSRADLEKLVRTASSLPGSICGRPASVWWLTLLAIEWDTGCRATELLSLRWEWIDWQTGWLVAPASCRKGRRTDAAYGLSQDTLAFLGRYKQPQGLILGWDHHRTRYWQLWGDLLKAAGLPSDRQHKTQCLRRSFASWLAAGGGDASAACGHSDGSVTRRHYLDPAICQRRFADEMPFRLLDLRDEK